MWVQLIALGRCPTTGLFIFFVLAQLFLGERREAWLGKSYLATRFLPKTNTSTLLPSIKFRYGISVSSFANQLFISFSEIMSALSIIKTLSCPPFTQTVDSPPTLFSLAQLFCYISYKYVGSYSAHLTQHRGSERERNRDVIRGQRGSNNRQCDDKISWTELIIVAG